MESEYDVRLAAVELMEKEWDTSAVAAKLGRSERWVRKWVSRYEAGGEAALVGRSRRPRSSPNRLSDVVVSEVLNVRSGLGDDRHANVGAKAIRARMLRDGVVDEVPSIASINRVLKDAGVARSYGKKRRSAKTILGLPAIVMAGIWQQADWVQDLWLSGGIKGPVRCSV